MFRQNRIKARSHNSLCKCEHPAVAHYRQDGSCVFPGCGCKGFKSTGSKHGNTYQKCNQGHSHDSGLESRVCGELEYRRKAKEIAAFDFHPVIRLPGPSGAIVATYEVDFTVTYPGTPPVLEYVEAKGRHLLRDGAWRIKWALLQDMHKGNPWVKFRVETD